MKRLFLIMAIAAAFVLAGCGAAESTVGGVSYEADNASQLMIDNESSSKLVVFNGHPGKGGTLMGGVPANADDFGMPNANDGMYVIYCMTENEYNENGNSGKIGYSTLVYVDSSRKTYYSVNSAPQGDAEIKLDNKSANYVELRNNSFQGPTWLTVLPYEHGSIYVQQGDYYLYPMVIIEKKESTSGNTIGLIRSAKAEQVKWMNVNNSDVSLISFPQDLSAGYQVAEATVEFFNQTGNGCEVINGSVVQETSLGFHVVNNGGTELFSFKSETEGNTEISTSIAVDIKANGPSAMSPGLSMEISTGTNYKVKATNLTHAPAVYEINQITFD